MYWFPYREAGTFKISTAAISRGLIAMIGRSGADLGNGADLSNGALAF